MIDVEYYTRLFFENDEPAPLLLNQGKNIYVYPILVKDYPIYELCKDDVLLIDKNSISDINIIKMSYLDYICGYVAKDKKYGKSFLNKFATLLKLVLHEDYIGVDTTKDNKYAIVIYEKNKNGEEIIKAIIKSKEFEDLKRIILHQNDRKYDDRYLSPDIRKAIEDYYKLKYSNCTAPSLERKKVYVISKTGILMQNINQMTYRTFDNVYKTLVDDDIYLANKILQSSEKYDIKDEIKHPMMTKEIDEFDQVFSNADSFEKKVQQGASGNPVNI
jgi:hypothetical protein